MFSKNIKVLLSKRIKVNCTKTNAATTNQLKILAMGKLGVNCDTDV